MLRPCSLLATAALALGCAPTLESDVCRDNCDEVGRSFSSESTLRSRGDQMLAYFEAGEVGTYVGAPDENGNEVLIQYHGFPHASERGAIVLVPGRTEAAIKYAEVVYDLQNEGYSVFILNHRGQGDSGRLLEDTLKGHVESYDDFHTDFSIFMRDIVRPNEHARVFGLSHSMGGPILGRYAIEYPLAFDAVVMSSPMFGINYPLGLGEGAAYTAAKANFKNTYALPYTDYTESFEDNEFTSSQARFDFAVTSVNATYPETIVAGPTNGWVEQSIIAMRDVRSRANLLLTPTLLFQAADDAIVTPAEQEQFCDNAQDCDMLVFDGRHELLMEHDTTRTIALEEALSFYEYFE